MGLLLHVRGEPGPRACGRALSGRWEVAQGTDMVWWAGTELGWKKIDFDERQREKAARQQLLLAAALGGTKK